MIERDMYSHAERGNKGSSYEKLREKIIKEHHIDTMVHLGPRAFEEIGGEVVQSVAFVFEKVNNA